MHIFEKELFPFDLFCQRGNGLCESENCIVKCHVKGKFSQQFIQYDNPALEYEGFQWLIMRIYWLIK